MARARLGSSELRRIARRALQEDRAQLDRTTGALFRTSFPAQATVVAQASGRLAGIDVAIAVAREAGLRTRPLLHDGARLTRGRRVLVVSGDGRRILTAERTMLNFLMHLSGVASSTARAVHALRGSRIRVYATRKTLPGLRDLEKAAVGAGGGEPHRRDLAAAILIKNNHLIAVPLPEAVQRARRAAGGRPVEVEVRTPHQALVAVREGAQTILIDNATPKKARAIVRQLVRSGLRSKVRVEASGGITPENASRFRTTGVDRVSMGALTHSAVAIPMHLILTRANR